MSRFTPRVGWLILGIVLLSILSFVAWRSSVRGTGDVGGDELPARSSMASTPNSSDSVELSGLADDDVLDASANEPAREVIRTAPPRVDPASVHRTSLLVGRVTSRSVEPGHVWTGTLELKPGRRASHTEPLPPTGAFTLVCDEGDTYELAVRVPGFRTGATWGLVRPGTNTVEIVLEREGDWPLELELRTTDGRSLATGLTRAQRDVAAYLRPVLTRDPVRVDEELPGDASLESVRGTCVLNEKDARWYEIRSVLPESGWCSVVLDDRVLATLPFRSSARRLSFTIAASALGAAASTLTGRVVSDELDVPIPSVEVVVTGVRNSKRKVSTEADGTFRIDDVLPGPISVTVTSAGHAPVRRGLAVVAGSTVDLGTIRLRRTARMAGRLALPAAYPTGWWIHAVRIEDLGTRQGTEGALPVRRTERVLPDGTFRCMDMERTEFAVTWTWGVLGTESLELPPDSNALGTGRYVDWRRVDLRGGDLLQLEWSVSETAVSEALDAVRALERESRGTLWPDDSNPGRDPIPKKPR